MNRTASLEQQPTIRIVPVPRNDLWAWLKAKDHVERGISRATHWTLDDVLHQFIDGRVQLTLIYDGDDLLGAMISEIICYPRKNVLFIHGISIRPGCNMNWFEETWSQVQDLARANGCQTVSASGRVGWLRQMPGAKSLNVWEVEI